MARDTMRVYPRMNSGELVDWPCVLLGSRVSAASHRVDCLSVELACLLPASEFI